MIPRFDWPAASAPTASITFPSGGQLRTDTDELVPNQAVKRAMGGTVCTDSYGPPERVFPYTVIVKAADESATDTADLLYFLEDVVACGVEAFDWTDEAGTVRRVRCLNDRFRFEVQGPAHRRCTLLLVEVG